MIDRGVTEGEVRRVLSAPTGVDQADQPPLVHYRAAHRGRDLQVTVNALTDTVVTVVTAPLAASGSRFGWFTLGAAQDARR